MESENLKRLIELIDDRLDRLPAITVRTSREDRSLHDSDVRGIVRHLEQHEGARERFRSGAYELRMAGVAASCTEGRFGLLRAWQRAARRRLPPPDDVINLQGSGPAPIRLREAS